MPGIMLLLIVIAGLYFLFRKAPAGRLEGEASRLKYILVWIIAGFLSNLFTNIFATIWGEAFPISILNPPDQLGMFTAFYAIAILGSYYIFIGTYSFFKDLDRRKVILFVWLASILGILLGIGQISALDLVTVYPDYANYNAIAIIVGQIVFLSLTLRWIRLNPGFVGFPDAPSQASSARTEPLIKGTTVSHDEDNSHYEPEPTVEPKSLSSTNATLSRSETVLVKQTSAKEKEPNAANSTKKSNDQNAENEKTVSDELQNENEQRANKKEILAKTEASKIVDNEEIPVDPFHIKDEIHAASKFGDKIELIKLLKADGFTIHETENGLSVQSPSGATELLINEQALFAYGKKYARN